MAKTIRIYAYTQENNFACLYKWVSTEHRELFDKMSWSLAIPKVFKNYRFELDSHPVIPITLSVLENLGYNIGLENNHDVYVEMPEKEYMFTKLKYG